MRRRTVIVLIFIVISGAIISTVIYGIYQLKMFFINDNIFSEITGGISNSIGDQLRPGYDPALECRKRSPELKTDSQGRILDGWGNPITISIQKLNDVYQVTITSPGSDGILGTKDDLRKDVEFYELKKATTNPTSTSGASPTSTR